MANIFPGYTDGWYPPEEPIIPKVYHKFLKIDDLKNSYPEIYSDETASTLQGRIDAVSNGSVVRLDKDYEEDIVIRAGKMIKLDMGSFNLKGKESDTITVEFGAALTIVGKGTIDNTVAGKAALYNNGIAIIDGPTLTKTAEEYYAVLNHGSLVVTGKTTIKLPTNATSSTLATGYYDFGRADERYGYIVGTNMEVPTCTIESGTIVGGRNAVKNDDNGVAYIYGGNIKGTQCDLFNVNKMYVYGCECITPNLDGTNVPEYGTPGWTLYTKYYDGGHDAGITMVYGGTYAGSFFADGDKSTIRITGGKFDREQNYLPTGYRWEKVAGSYVPVAGSSVKEENA